MTLQKSPKSASAVLEKPDFKNFDVYHSRLCVEKDFHTEEYKRACNAIGEAHVLHRKYWEFVYIYNVLESLGKLTKGASGLGFGVGTEPLVPAFANRGVSVTATDQAFESARDQGWAQTNQHMGSIDTFMQYVPKVCSEEALKSNVRTNVCDMNNINDEYRQGQFDFTWSACSFEHLGSLQAGIDFILNSIECLKPGGVGVHTTEYNVKSNWSTFYKGPTVIYRKRDLKKLEKEVVKRGGRLLPLNFDLGDQPADNHVDVPPYKLDPHLKLQLGKFVTTSVGLVIIKD